MSEQERKDKARKFWQDMQNTVANLSARWADEKEYEDIEDYRKVITDTAKTVCPEVVVGNMMKRPFGFLFTLDNVRYMLSITSNGGYSYKRI